ncbi:Uncharacterized protein APZ42_011023 [Daphnia magna]|uniref:Uncharacterized protein n=1 Tax=Daphnia magna TaxID=35525 RepID=A0A162T4I5_9CRUS|nr:Uncharacterized protein APZ42_011023 [Daphnia magna]
MEKWICSNVNRIRDEIRLQQGAETQPLRGWGGGRKWKGMIRLFYLTLMCLFSLSISSAWAYISLSDARRKRKLIQHSTKKSEREREKGEREAAHST